MRTRYPFLIAIAVSQLCSVAAAEPTNLGPLPISLTIVDQQVQLSAMGDVDIHTFANGLQLQLKGTLDASANDVRDALRATANGSLPYTTTQYTCRVTLKRLRSVDVKSTRNDTIVISGVVIVEGEGILCPVAAADAPFSFELLLSTSENQIAISIPTVPSLELTIFGSKKNVGESVLATIQEQVQKLTFQLPPIEGAKIRLRSAALSRQGSRVRLRADADIMISSKSATDFASHTSLLQTPFVLNPPPPHH